MYNSLERRIQRLEAIAHRQSVKECPPEILALIDEMIAYSPEADEETPLSLEEYFRLHGFSRYGCYVALSP